jgi:hypothetical protein
MAEIDCVEILAKYCLVQQLLTFLWDPISPAEWLGVAARPAPSHPEPERPIKLKPNQMVFHKNSNRINFCYPSATSLPL